MPALFGVEATMDALVAKLESELGTKIDAINAEVNDDYVIEQPVGISFGPRSEIPYPWVVVMPSVSDPLIDSSGRTHEEHAVDIVAWVQDPDEEALWRRLIRYHRALREVALHYRRPAASYTDGGGGYGLQYAGTDYGLTFTDANLFVGSVSSTYRVQQQQDL
jgi:hypothetical protein